MVIAFPASFVGRIIFKRFLARPDKHLRMRSIFSLSGNTQSKVDMLDIARKFEEIHSKHLSGLEFWHIITQATINVHRSNPFMLLSISDCTTFCDLTSLQILSLSLCSQFFTFLLQFCEISSSASAFMLWNAHSMLIFLLFHPQPFFLLLQPQS
jgi:hypothetical protein